MVLLAGLLLRDYVEIPQSKRLFLGAYYEITFVFPNKNWLLLLFFQTQTQTSEAMSSA